MRDFPLFTTDSGVASIVLKQVPYDGSAYITIQDSAEPDRLLEECCEFCKAVGAKSVYASGHDCLKVYPLHTAVVLMRCLREQLEETNAALFPVQKETLKQFREIYNAAMKSVPNASYMTDADSKKFLEEGNGYFVHRDKEILGIGIAAGERISAIVSCVPGCGRDVLLALNHALSGTCVEVEVATKNTRAIHLYERLGFVCCREISSWYKII